jgi:hypothetical protein
MERHRSKTRGINMTFVKQIFITERMEVTSSFLESNKKQLYEKL